MRKTRKTIFTQSVRRAIQSKTGQAVFPIQVGGGIVAINGFRYNYRDIEGGMTIFGGRHGSKRPCFIIFLENDTAILQNIESGSDCSLDKDATTKHTVLAAAKLAKERGAKTLTFTDNSTKHIADGLYFRLSNMYFLTTGKTWYESILPCRLVSPQNARKYEIWKHRAATNTWADIYNCLKKEFPTLDLEIDIDDISAMRVLQRLKEEKSDFFATYEAELLMCSGVGSLHDLEWICDL